MRLIHETVRYIFVVNIQFFFLSSWFCSASHFHPVKSKQSNTSNAQRQVDLIFLQFLCSQSEWSSLCQQFAPQSHTDRCEPQPPMMSNDQHFTATGEENNPFNPGNPLLTDTANVCTFTSTFPHTNTLLPHELLWRVAKPTSISLKGSTAVSRAGKPDTECTQR